MQMADCCKVCLIAPRADVALVFCGHSRFRTSCAGTVAIMANGCPILPFQLTWCFVFSTNTSQAYADFEFSVMLTC